MLYVLCYPRLEPEVAAAIEDFRRRHEPERARLVRAHITLMFGLAGVSPDELARHVGEVAATCNVFDLSLERVEAHSGLSPSEQHLFLMIGRAADLLTSLHRALYTGPLAAQRREDAPFRPHMTIATADSDAAIAEALRDAGQLGLPLRSRIDALHVVRRTEANLEEVERLPLKS